jgi:enoyl-[acyl-carrier-protein] reductase (NADH)
MSFDEGFARAMDISCHSFARMAPRPLCCHAPTHAPAVVA